MSKQCLDVQQMQHLQELGLELDYDTLCRYVKFEDTDWLLKPSSDLNIIGISCRYIPAYTLQDVLDVLPTSIRHNDCTYYLGMAKRGIAYELYSEHGMVQAIQFGRRILIDAAYEMLCWLIEQGYVETNKNE